MVTKIDRTIIEAMIAEAIPLRKPMSSPRFSLSASAEKNLVFPWGKTN